MKISSAVLKLQHADMHNNINNFTYECAFSDMDTTWLYNFPLKNLSSGISAIIYENIISAGIQGRTQQESSEVLLTLRMWLYFTGLAKQECFSVTHCL
jgi:hypothetical protein